MDLSVIICTRNRAANLATLFTSLDSQKLPPPIEWEVVVVDNGSTDGTAEAIKAQAASQPRYRYYREERTGKSFALNRGLAEARGRILAFTDDDCIADENWLREIFSEFERDPKLGVLGGRVELFDPRDKPISIVTKRERTTISRVKTFIEPVIIGCNMAVRKQAFDAVGNYDADMAPGSKSSAITEDIDVIYRIVRRGWNGLYSPAMLVRHNHGRRTDEEMKGLLFRYCTGRGAFYAKHMFHDPKVAYCALWDIIKPVKLILRGEEVEREKTFLRAMTSGFFRRLFR